MNILDRNKRGKKFTTGSLVSEEYDCQFRPVAPEKLSAQPSADDWMEAAKLTTILLLGRSKHLGKSHRKRIRDVIRNAMLDSE